MNRNSPRSARSDRKKQRDKRVAALSLDLVPQKNQWTTRIATQVLLADELHEAITLCLKAGYYAIYSVRSPDCAAGAANDLDAIYVFKHHILEFPINAGEKGPYRRFCHRSERVRILKSHYRIHVFRRPSCWNRFGPFQLPAPDEGLPGRCLLQIA